MSLAITGLHHVTAISGDARRNADFYTRVLGLRLVKCTVHFEDDRTCHLYYGNPDASPGTLLTFFVRDGAPAGRTGRGQATAVRLAVPADAIDWWQRRLADEGILARTGRDAWREPRLAFRDPEGLPLELAGESGPALERRTRHRDGQPHGILGLHSVELSVPSLPDTRALLADVMGLRDTALDDRARAFAPPAPGSGVIVDVRTDMDGPAGEPGTGTVHHVAFRMGGDGTQHAWQARVRGAGVDVTDVKDRKYFRSIYFWEPGGTKLELATDGPGFTVDESPAALGTRLQLPAAFEAGREALERRFAPARLFAADIVQRDP